MTTPTRDQHIRSLLGRLDHFSLPCRDPQRSATFYEAVLGARIYEDEHGPYIFGVSEADKALGRSVHIFMQMASGQRFELLGLDTHGEQPAGTHHAFAIGPNDVPAVRAHLESLGVPYWGPSTHKSTNAVSIYTKDLDANVLEFCSWSGYPDMPSIPLSQHMPKPPLRFEWDAAAKRARPISE